MKNNERLKIQDATCSNWNCDSHYKQLSVLQTQSSHQNMDSVSKVDASLSILRRTPVQDTSEVNFKS